MWHLNINEFFDCASRAIGEENVSRRPDTGALEGVYGQPSYGDAFSPDNNHEPIGAVRPGKVEGIQEILRIANWHRVPLWTISRGRNMG